MKSAWREARELTWLGGKGQPPSGRKLGPPGLSAAVVSESKSSRAFRLVSARHDRCAYRHRHSSRDDALRTAPVASSGLCRRCGQKRRRSYSNRCIREIDHHMHREQELGVYWLADHRAEIGTGETFSPGPAFTEIVHVLSDGSCWGCCCRRWRSDRCWFFSHASRALIRATDLRSGSPDRRYALTVDKFHARSFVLL